MKVHFGIMVPIGNGVTAMVPVCSPEYLKWSCSFMWKSVNCKRCLKKRSPGEELSK